MPTYTAVRKWRRWAGTLGDLDRAVGVAVEGLTEWLGEEPINRITVALPDLTLEFDKFEDLQAISEHDTRKIKRIHIWVNWLHAPTVSIDVDRGSPALSLEVKGNDRIRVDGLRTRLGDLLDTGHRQPRWYGDRGMIFVLGLTAIWAPWGAVLIGLQNLASLFHWPLPVHGNSIELIPLIGSGVFVAVVVTAFFWLFPDLELLVPGERTRFRRFRASVYVVLLGVVSILIAAPINILFGPRH